MEIKEIIKKYENDELNKDIDEKGAGGFWDLAGEITYKNVMYGELPKSSLSILDELQTDIYHAFLEIYETEKISHYDKKLDDDIQRLLKKE